jgi:hypothetical protein
MRGGDIDGPWQWDEIICPTCFAVLAERAGVASRGWRLVCDEVTAVLTTTTPSGRVWDESLRMWVQP